MKPTRIALLTVLSALPVTAFAAATGADGGFLASVCGLICGGGCCG